MGVLSKLLAGNEPKISRPALPQPQPLAKQSRPTSPCRSPTHPGPTPPYGLHHWLDLYGSWHCTQCEPPASVAMVRDEVLVDPGCGHGANDPPRGNMDQITQAMNPAGFRIVAISDPGGQIIFSPTATQAERREAVDNFQWFDRVDSRL